MEDPRDKVMKTLESNGTLDYIKAQLRSKVYSVLNDSNQFLQKPDTAKVTETELGEIAAELIRDFMEYFSLNFTLNIFIPECHLNSKKKELNFIENKLKIRASHDKPILFTVLEKLINETTAFSSQSSRLNTASTTDSFASFGKQQTAQPIQSIPQKTTPKSLYEDTTKSTPKSLYEDTTKTTPKSLNEDTSTTPKSLTTKLTPDTKAPTSKLSEPSAPISKPFLEQSKPLPEPSLPSSRVDLTKLAPLKPVNKSLPSLDLVKKVPQSNSRSTFSDIDAQLGDLSGHIDSSIEESIEFEEESVTNRDHDVYESYGASSSLGIDASVNSEVIENYDYIEDIKAKR